jgi:hypothetical protein
LCWRIRSRAASRAAKKQRPTLRGSFNSDNAGLVIADPLANLKADFQSLKADYESLIIANFKSQLDRKNERQPSARTNALRPNWSMNRTGRKVQEMCGLQGTGPQSFPPPQSQSERQTPLQLNNQPEGHYPTILQPTHFQLGTSMRDNPAGLQV